MKMLQLMEDGLTAPLMSQMLGAEHLQFPRAPIQGIHFQQCCSQVRRADATSVHVYGVCARTAAVTE